MAEPAELVSQLRAALTHGLDLKNSKKVLHALQDKFLVPNGLYLNGGLSHFGADSLLSPEIVGLVTRADGRDLTEPERKKVEAWLGSIPQITEYSLGSLKPSNSPEFVPIGSVEENE